MTVGRSAGWSARPPVRPSALAVILAVLGAPVQAQVTHSRQPTAANVRTAYLEEVGKLTTETTDRLKKAVQKDDTDGILKLFTPGGLYSPASGGTYYGAEAIRVSLGERLPKYGGLALTRVDWTASGNLAYLYGRYTYGPTTEGGAVDQGTYVMVLLLEGREWKIRSLIERAGP